MRNKLVCVGNGERLDSNQQAPCTETEAYTDGTSDPRVQEGRFSSLFWPGVQQRQGLLAFACSQSRSIPLRAALESEAWGRAWRPMPPNQASHPLPQYKVSWGAPVRRPLGDQGGRAPPAPAGLLLSSIRAQRNSIELCCLPASWICMRRHLLRERSLESRCRDLLYMGWFRGSSLMFWIQTSSPVVSELSVFFR